MDLKNGNDTLAASFASSFSSIFNAFKNLFSSLMAIVGAFVKLTSVLKPLLVIFLLPTLVILQAISLAFDILTLGINSIVIGLSKFGN
jgi:hypothetical protein